MTGCIKFFQFVQHKAAVRGLYASLVSQGKASEWDVASERKPRSRNSPGLLCCHPPFDHLSYTGERWRRQQTHGAKSWVMKVTRVQNPTSRFVHNHWKASRSWAHPGGSASLSTA